MNGSIKAILILVVLGLPMLIFGLNELYQANEFVRNGAYADGVIVEMKKGSGILSKYHPRVRFQTADGETIEFIPGNGSNPPMYETHEHVPVVYNPDHPRHAAINSFIEIWLGPSIYAGLGLIFLISSGFQWRRYRSQSK